MEVIINMSKLKWNTKKENRYSNNKHYIGRTVGTNLGENDAFYISLHLFEDFRHILT